jgi:hypothetical protein
MTDGDPASPGSPFFFSGDDLPGGVPSRAGGLPRMHVCFAPRIIVQSQHCSKFLGGEGQTLPDVSGAKQG